VVDEAPEIEPSGLVGFLVRLIGLKRKELIRVTIFLGVLGMLVHVAWICGWLVAWGAEVPYARADDLAQTKANVAVLSKSVADLTSGINQSLALNIAGEIRAQVKLRCDPHSQQGVRDLIDASIDQLQARYSALTGHRYHEPGCTAP